MKTFFILLGTASLLVGPGTVFVFAYRYIWFSIQTIPADRWDFAMGGATAFAIAALVAYMIAFNVDWSKNKRQY